MSVLIKLSATLRDKVPGYDSCAGIVMELPPDSTAQSLALQIGLPLADIKIVMVNSRQATLEQALADGDRVAYFPAVGGG